MPDQSRRVLWENVLALMVRKWGRENVTGFATWTGIGVGSVLRIREQKTSVGLDIVEKIAKKVGLEHSWQLLVPGLDALSPPMLAEDAAELREIQEQISRTHEAMSGVLRSAGERIADDAAIPVGDPLLGGNSQLGGLDEAPRSPPPRPRRLAPAKKSSKR